MYIYQPLYNYSYHKLSKSDWSVAGVLNYLEDLLEYLDALRKHTDTSTNGIYCLFRNPQVRSALAALGGYYSPGPSDPLVSVSDYIEPSWVHARLGVLLIYNVMLFSS